MNRKWLWLTLPVAMCALAWSVKWRIDHPTPTTFDLEMRALLSRCSEGEVSIVRGNGRSTWQGEVGLVTGKELEVLINSLHLTRGELKSSVIDISSHKVRKIIVHVFHRSEKSDTQTFKSINVSFICDAREQKTRAVEQSQIQSYSYVVLKPVTAKRWLDFLLNHPRIGPELRARLKR